MKLALYFLFFCVPLNAQVIRQNGNSASGSSTVSSITVTNLGVGGIVFSSTPSNGRLSVDASNLFWDDANNSLGIGTNSPATTLDVNGAAQFGSGASKSTFSAAGFLTITGSTLTVNSTGRIDGPGQFYADVSTVGATTANASFVDYTFVTVTKNVGGMFSSGSPTVVTLGGLGTYFVTCYFIYPYSIVGSRYGAIYINGGIQKDQWEMPTTDAAISASKQMTVSDIVSGTANTMGCRGYQNSTVTQAVSVELKVLKLW